MKKKEIVDDIIFEVKKLLSEERNKLNQDDWYEHSQNVVEKLKLYTAYVDIPHELWHYLADYDIRCKDTEYASKQLDYVCDLIISMELA